MRQTGRATICMEGRGKKFPPGVAGGGGGVSTGEPCGRGRRATGRRAEKANRSPELATLRPPGARSGLADSRRYPVPSRPPRWRDRPIFLRPYGGRGGGWRFTQPQPPGDASQSRAGRRVWQAASSGTRGAPRTPAPPRTPQFLAPEQTGGGSDFSEVEVRLDQKRARSFRLQPPRQ